MPYQFAQPESLIATEEVEENAVEHLRQSILCAQAWTRPIAVERNHMLVMDGHHRLEVAKRLHLAIVPIVLLDYQCVSVTGWRADDHITPEDIFAMARSGRKFPIKTTRHIFADNYPGCNVPLSTLIGHPTQWKTASDNNRAVRA